MSLLDTSYLSPTDANDETPMPSRSRCSSSATPMPPDCTTMPAVPGAGVDAVKVAFRLPDVLITPRQFGPTSRIP